MPPKRAVARVTVAKAKKAKATVVSNGHIERAAEEHVEMVASSVKASVNEPPRPIVSCEEGRKRIYKAGTNEFKICCWNLNGKRVRTRLLLVENFFKQLSFFFELLFLSKVFARRCAHIPHFLVQVHYNVRHIIGTRRYRDQCVQS